MEREGEGNREHRERVTGRERERKREKSWKTLKKRRPFVFSLLSLGAFVTPLQKKGTNEYICSFSDNLVMIVSFLFLHRARVIRKEKMGGDVGGGQCEAIKNFALF